jgi:putative membrane protein
MTFVDTIAFQLFTIAFVAILLFYAGISTYWEYLKRGFREAYRLMKAQAVVLSAIGLVILIIGFWGEFVWPISTIVNGANVLGAYDILFYDPYIMMGMALLGFSACVILRLDTKYSGLFALMVGALSIYYGTNAYSLGLTKEPTIMLLLYVAFGITGIFSFPFTLFIDRIIMGPLQGESTASSAQKPLTPFWKFAFACFVIFLLFSAISAILAIFIGGGALAPHLASPP